MLNFGDLVGVTGDGAVEASAMLCCGKTWEDFLQIVAIRRNRNLDFAALAICAIAPKFFMLRMHASCETVKKRLFVFWNALRSHAQGKVVTAPLGRRNGCRLIARAQTLGQA
jgi:hypothetical protein